jgi:ornithine--oxo-acid transaminase
MRGRGLLVGIELTVKARPFCEALMERGLLCKETHDFVVRIAPPLVVSKDDLEWALSQIRETFSEMS